MERELGDAFRYTDLPEAVLWDSSFLPLAFVVYEALRSLVYSAAPSSLQEAEK
jgi:hypothetical protein